ncbi:hypothetical protein BEWA_032590 [Theileria equi strain WA]|uniref:Ribonuclease P/MRP protein subunit POP5 n=1 Tax=Theileria equi strain WA TaxID=1537102 RepID=L0AZJ2_THEEQ|nr:hypothetical protein BEWA_032590 [Theileria equi strain WA]AFZ80406.1 hypothetical protein BEWA_032590 [Theileria equi strain WA]|eukprot:XP_004830072.1 hypothetical protein BEWA_032590 [Theileria equi strain WA]
MTRVKNRWIVVRVLLKDELVRTVDQLERILKPDVLIAKITQTSKLLYGNIKGNFISSSISISYINTNESLVLFHSRRHFLDEFLCILSFIDKIQKVGVSLEVIHVSGTLHQTRKFIFNRILDTLSQLSALRLSNRAQETPS